MAGTSMTTPPSFLTARRERAVSTLGALELPSFRGIAGWEFTPIDKLDLDAFERRARRRRRRRAASVVVRRAATARSRPDGASEATVEGPLVMPLALAAERHPDLVEQHLGSVVQRNDPFTARNEAHWADGAFVYVPRGVAVDAPILLDLVHEQAGTALHARTLIVLEEGAEAEVWEQALSADPEAEGLVNTRRRDVVGQNATLRYVAAQDLSEKTWVFCSQRAIVERDGAPGLDRRSASARATARCSSRRTSRAPARTPPSPARTRRTAASTWTSTRCRSTPRRTRRRTSPSAGSSTAARRPCGGG